MFSTIGQSGCEEADSCLVVCDHLSHGFLLQQWFWRPLPVGRPKVHTGGERWKRWLQTGRVGKRLYTLIGFWQLFNLWFGFLQELWRFSGRPVWSAGFRMSAGALAVWRWPTAHRGRNHEHFLVLDQRGWRSDLLSGFSFRTYLITVLLDHRLDTVTSLTSSGEL